MARSQFLIFIASLIFFSMSCYALETSNATLSLNIAKIQKLTGQTGQFDQNQKIYKITIPRDDLKILMSGMQMTSDMGLSSWIAFKKTDNQTSVNGDLILLQDQINPVMSVALTNGLQVTGLHNPYLWDSPRVMFMHITGEGDELQLASAVGQVLKKIKATSNGGGDFPLGNFDFLRTTLDAHKIDVILGQKGQFKDDVYKIEFGDGIKVTDTEINKIMALNTWAAFAGSDSEAVVNGTIVLHESELQKALVKLRNAQIYVLAIYQNMINAERDLVLINFWGVGNTQTLARTLRSVFFIAQNTDPANITVGGILPDTSITNMETEVGITPVQLSLYKNDNCGYVKAKELYTSLDTIQNINVDYAKQLGATLRIAFHLTQKIVSEKMTELVSFLPATSQIIQSTKRDAEVLPSARNLLLKLSVVSNNVPEFVKLLASAPTGTSVSTKSLANTIPVGLPNIGGRFHAYITNLITSYMENSKLHIASISAASSAVVTYAYVHINEFVTSYTNVFKSLAHVISTAVTHVYTHINRFGIGSANLFHSFAHAASVAVVHDINAFAALSANISQSFDDVTFTAVACVHTHVNEFAILSVNAYKSFAHTVSVVGGHVYASVNEFAIASINIFQSLAHAASIAMTHDINTLTAFSLGVLQSSNYATFTAVTHLYSDINEFAVLCANVSKSFVNIVSSAVTYVHANVNEFVILSVNTFQSFAHAVSAAVTRVYASITKFSLSSINVFQSLAHAASVKATRDINTLAALSTNVSQSFAHVVSAVVKHMHANITEFTISSISMFQAVAHAASIAITRDIHTLAALSINVSQSFDYATFTAVARGHENISKFAILCGNVSKSFINSVSVMVAYVHADVNESAILSVNMFQSFAHAVSSEGTRVDVNITKFALSSGSVLQSLAHVTSLAATRDINTLAALSTHVSQLFDYAAFTAVKQVHTQLNEFTVVSVNISKSFANTISTIVMRGYTHINKFAVLSSHSFSHGIAALVSHVHANINKFAILSVSGYRLLARTTFFFLSETAGFAHSYITNSIISSTQSFSLVKNTVTQMAQSSANQSVTLLAAMTKPAPNAVNSIGMTQSSSKFLAIASGTENKIPSVLKPLTKILSPRLLPPRVSPTSASTVQVASGQAHDQITKSLSSILPVTQHKVIIAASKKILPGSLPMPQHTVIRVATLSTLSSVIPVTHHKVKAVPVIQNKTIKVAELSPPSLPSVQSIKNHNVPRIKSVVKPLSSSAKTKIIKDREQHHDVSGAKWIMKPSISFAQIKTVKHRAQLNKELSATLHIAQRKHALYVPSKDLIHPVVHNIKRKPIEKITEKPHEIAHALSNEKNWNTEQLAPQPIHVAQKQVYRTQEEFDDGPAVIGAYPYDEEPTPDGFGG